MVANTQGCLILTGYFSQKTPVISGSFAKNDLQLQASCESLHPLAVSSVKKRATNYRVMRIRATHYRVLLRKMVALMHISMQITTQEASCERGFDPFCLMCTISSEFKGISHLCPFEWAGVDIRWCSVDGFDMRWIRLQAAFCAHVHTLRQGWVLLKRTWEISEIQFAKHFIEFVLVETNEVVSCNSHVKLTRQTCGQRSSRVAGSKRRAIGNYCSIRIWYVFSVSTRRPKSDLGLYMTLVPAKRIRPQSADFRFQNVFGRSIRRKSALRSRILSASTQVMSRPRSDFPLLRY